MIEEKDETVFHSKVDTPYKIKFHVLDHASRTGLPGVHVGLKGTRKNKSAIKKRMKATAYDEFGGPEKVKARTIDVPEVKEGEVLGGKAK